MQDVQVVVFHVKREDVSLRDGFLRELERHTHWDICPRTALPDERSVGLGVDHRLAPIAAHRILPGARGVASGDRCSGAKPSTQPIRGGEVERSIRSISSTGPARGEGGPPREPHDRKSHASG